MVSLLCPSEISTGIGFLSGFASAASATIRTEPITTAERKRAHVFISHLGWWDIVAHTVGRLFSRRSSRKLVRSSRGTKEYEVLCRRHLIENRLGMLNGVLPCHGSVQKKKSL